MTERISQVYRWKLDWSQPCVLCPRPISGGDVAYHLRMESGVTRHAHEECARQHGVKRGLEVVL